MAAENSVLYRRGVCVPAAFQVNQPYWPESHAGSISHAHFAHLKVGYFYFIICRKRKDPSRQFQT
jgi:hypothetical protein